MRRSGEHSGCSSRLHRRLRRWPSSADFSQLVLCVPLDCSHFVRRFRGLCDFCQWRESRLKCLPVSLRRKLAELCRATQPVDLSRTMDTDVAWCACLPPGLQRNQAIALGDRGKCVCDRLAYGHSHRGIVWELSSVSADCEWNLWPLHWSSNFVYTLNAVYSKY